MGRKSTTSCRRPAAAQQRHILSGVHAIMSPSQITPDEVTGMDLQHVFDYLAEEGYRPQRDADGDITFKK